MDYGISNDIDITRLPYIFAGIAILVYLFLYYKMRAKKPSGYYGIVFSTLRVVSIVPFWGFMVVFSYYIFNQDFRELINLNKEHISFKSIMMKNDLSETKHFYMLIATPDSTVEDDKVVYHDTWHYAQTNHSLIRIPNFSVPPFVEKKIWFECPANASKLYLRMINEGENKWKTAAAATVIEINDGITYIFTKDLVSNRIPKIKPVIADYVFHYLLFYGIALFGILYHLLALRSNPMPLRRYLLIFNLLIGASCLWVIFNYGIQLWFRFFP